MWSATPTNRSDPDGMIEWLRARAKYLTLVEQRLVAEKKAATLRQQEAEAKTLVRAELHALDIIQLLLPNSHFTS